MPGILFRQQAVNRQANRLHGNVLLTLPIPVYIVSGVIFLLLLASIIFASLFPYANAVTVSGYLSYGQGAIKVPSPKNARIEELFIKEGQRVKKGDRLMLLNEAKSYVGDTTIEQNILDELNEQKSLLEQKLRDNPETYRLKRQELAVEYKSNRDQVHILQQRLKHARNRADEYHQSYVRYQDLAARKMISTDTVSQNKAVWLDAQSDADEIENAISELLARQNQIHISIKNSRMEENEARINLESSLSELKQSILKHRSDFKTEVMAPISGAVSSLLVQENQTIRVDDLLFSVVPENSDLQIKLLLPSRTVGYVKPGQKVLLRMDAFPYEKYGLFKAYIHTVAHTPVLPGEASFPVKFDDPVYLASATLDKKDVNRYRDKFNFRSDMTLKADIMLGTRPLIKWLLSPIFMRPEQ